jgi:hypothetical protein
MDLANGAFDDRCAGLRDLFRAPASTVPSSCALITPRPGHRPSVTSAQPNTTLLFKNSNTPGSAAAGSPRPSTIVATIASQRSLNAIESAERPTRTGLAIV